MQPVGSAHGKLDRVLLMGLGLSGQSARIVMEEIEQLRGKVAELTELLKATRRYRIGYEVPMEWFIKRDIAIRDTSIVAPNAELSDSRPL